MSPAPRLQPNPNVSGAIKFGFPLAHSRLLTLSAAGRSARYVDLPRAEPDAGTDRGRAWIAVPPDR
jgi:hypothetical protein